MADGTYLFDDDPDSVAANVALNATAAALDVGKGNLDFARPPEQAEEIAR